LSWLVNPVQRVNEGRSGAMWLLHFSAAPWRFQSLGWRLIVNYGQTRLAVGQAPVPSPVGSQGRVTVESA